MLLLLCGDIKSLPGPIWRNKRRDSLLTCRDQVISSKRNVLHAKFNQSTLFLCDRDTDFLTFSKTHTQGTDNFDIFSIPGYHYIRKSRAIVTGGGVGLYVSDKHDFVHRKDL